jgi:argininosuccinate synthase
MKHREGGSPYSMDANLLHISFEGRALEDPAVEPEEDMWRWTVSPEKAPDQPEYVELSYEKGDIVALNGTAMSPAQVLTELNRLGGKHGIGRVDLVENRYVGMKSRGATRRRAAASCSRRTARSNRSRSIGRSPTSRTS